MTKEISNSLRGTLGAIGGVWIGLAIVQLLCLIPKIQEIIRHTNPSSFIVLSIFCFLMGVFILFISIVPNKKELKGK